jgi:hypothetical protein
MKNNRLLVAACLVAGLSLVSPPFRLATSPVAAAQVATSSPYFGQPVPSLTPERFAHGVVTTDAIELNGVFAPGLNEFFFARRLDDVNTMFHLATKITRGDSTREQGHPVPDVQRPA